MVTGTGPDRLHAPPQGSPCLRPSSGLRSSPAVFFFPQVESSVNGAHQKRALFPNRCVKLLGTENAPRREAAPATLKVESLGEGHRTPRPRNVLPGRHEQAGARHTPQTPAVAPAVASASFPEAAVLPRGRRGPPAPCHRGPSPCRNPATNSYLPKHEVVTLNRAGNRRDFP